MQNKRRYLSFLLLAATIACSNDPEVPGSDEAEGDAIRFGSKITGIARSKAIIEDEKLPDGSAIGVFGWGHHKNDGDVNTTLRTDLNNTKYTQTAGQSELKAEVPGHYPVNPDTLLNFYAYHPYLIAAAANPLQIPFTLTSQHDLLWADPVKNRDKTTAGRKVEFAFQHMLCAITIKIKKADGIAEDFLLESISLENYPDEARLNVQSGILTPATVSTPFPLIAGQETVMGKEPTTILTDYLVYPTDRPVFIIRMNGATYPAASTKAFLPGKRQTYEFTIQASDITLSGSIRPWEDGGNSEETIYF